MLAGAEQAGLLEQQRQFEEVGNAVGLRDDAVGQGGGAVALAQFAGGEEDGQFAPGFLGIVQVGRVKRARRGDFLDQQRDAVDLGKRLVIRAAAGAGEQFGDAAGVDFGVLAQVDRRQVEAENLHGAQQPAQAATGQRGAAVQLERIRQHLEVGAQGIGVVIRRGVADFVADRLDVVEGAGGGGDPGVNAGQRAAVGFVGTLRRVIGGALGEVVQFRRGGDQQVGQRQLAAEFVDFVEIVIERGRRLQAQGLAQDFGGDEGVAVAVAADPGADPEKRRQRPVFVGIALVQLLRDLDIEARQFGEEGFVEDN